MLYIFFFFTCYKAMWEEPIIKLNSRHHSSDTANDSAFVLKFYVLILSLKTVKSSERRCLKEQCIHHFKNIFMCIVQVCLNTVAGYHAFLVLCANNNISPNFFTLNPFIISPQTLNTGIM